MKIRKLKIGEEIEYNDYVIHSETSGLLAVKINTKKIYGTISGLIGCTIEEVYGKKERKLFADFLEDNIDLFYETVEQEIQYVLDSFAMTFCTLNDDFNGIRKNFYKIGNKMENLIVFLVYKNVAGKMIEQYEKEMNL